MKQLRSYAYQFYPGPEQVSGLNALYCDMRDWYNSCIQDRDAQWSRHHVRISGYDQEKSICVLRREEYYSRWTHATYQGICRRVDQSYKRFFSGSSGRPRYKIASRFKSIILKLRNGAQLNGFKLTLSGITGDLRVNWHRPLPPKYSCKSVRVTNKLGKWFVTFLIEADFQETCGTGNVGVDLGLTNHIATSEGYKPAVPRLERKSHKRIRRLQRALDRCRRGSNRRKKARDRLAAAHGKVARQRSDYAHKLSRALVSKYKNIAFEDLKIRSMVRSRRFARSIHDAAWGQIVAYTTYKAESAGGTVALVDPRHTSQTCPDCGRIERKPLSLRRHRCGCGADYDRDVAAAMVIRDRAFPKTA